MTASIGQNARIISDGFHLFAHQPVQVTTFMIPDVFLVQTPLSLDAIEVFRSFRIGGGKIRHDKSNIAFDLYNQSLVLSEIYMTPDFGISVVTDPELARFEFRPVSTFTNFGKVFQFKTMDGFQFEPHCYYKIL